MGEPRPRRTWAALLLLAAGCRTDGIGRDNRHDDPLLGLRSGGPPAAVATTTGGPPPPAYQPKPPLTAATPTSNAALAGGGFQPLPGSSDLRIGSGAQPQQPGFTDPRAGGGAPPPPTGFSPVTPVPPPGTPVNNTQPGPAAGPIGSLEQAYAAVAARGPRWHKMTFNSQTGEYMFQLSVPSRLNTAASQNVEATAGSPTEAIRRALEQLGQ